MAEQERVCCVRAMTVAESGGVVISRKEWWYLVLLIVYVLPVSHRVRYERCGS